MPTIQEALTQARATMEAPEPAPAVETPAVEAAPEPEAPAEAPEVELSAEASPPSTRERNADGTFKPKAPEKPGKPGETARKPEGTPAVQGAKGPAVGQPPATAAPPPVAEEPKAPPIKPPQSLRASTREAWDKVPREIQEDIARIDREVRKTMQDSAQARQFAGQVQQSLSVYAPIAQANGKDVMTWAGEGLQSYAALMQGAPEAAVNAAAQAVKVLMQRFGQPAVEMLAAAVEGKGGAPLAPAPQSVDVAAQVQKVIDERLAKVQQDRLMSEASAFVESAPEFLNEVHEDMVALLEAARLRGQKMTYQQAYDKACKLNEEVSAILAQREAAKKAGTATAATRQSQAAAVSPRSSPVTAPEGKPSGVQGAIAAARAKLGMTS